MVRRLPSVARALPPGHTRFLGVPFVRQTLRVSGLPPLLAIWRCLSPFIDANPRSCFAMPGSYA